MSSQIRQAWSASDDAILRERWRAGDRAVDIGRRIGVSREAVVARAGRIGLGLHPTIGKPAFWTTERVERLSSQLRAGLSRSEVAALWGKSVGQIEYAVWRYDLGRKSRHLTPSAFERERERVAAEHGLAGSDLCRPRRTTKARQHLMWCLRARGYSLGQIGAAMNLHHTTVLHGAEAHEARRRGTNHPQYPQASHTIHTPEPLNRTGTVGESVP